jgi:ribonucleoside-triphosphate reductase
MDQYQNYIHTSRYARWREEDNRRETWEETVDRYVGFWLEKELISHKVATQLKHAIVNQEIMPSMRAMMTAGPALAKDNVAGFNCAYTTLDNVRAFDEIMYVLMCGTGVGFSEERQYVNQLPEIAEDFHDTDTIIKVADSKIGWAKSFRELLSLLYAGQIPQWDVSAVRPSGAILKTFGGRASGPEPLVDLFTFSTNLFRNASGRKLSSIECHDLVCKIADIVVVGGVRRSALIALSNLSDDRMRHAKSGNWFAETPHRQLANNSAVYAERPEFETFLNEWKSLYESKSGERGVFSRAASKNQAAANGRRDTDYEFGTNPCSEIILRPNQFCNLSEVVVRSGDTMDDLKRKVRLATILGTLQSTLTNFRYLRKSWRTNTEEERLLGVSLTGIMDHPQLSNSTNYELPQLLESLKNEAIKTNKKWAESLGIPQSTAITCVKPSGTVSQLVNSASGIHTRYSPFYVRRVRSDKKDPVSVFLKEAGVPCEDAIGNDSTEIFSFPVAAPENAVTEADITALEALELWMVYQRHWCEHKPSVTISYEDDEFLGVGNWLWNNLDEVSGVSFLPKTKHVYPQAPYEEITEADYNERVASMPVIDWDKLAVFESEDRTTGSQELACVGGSCEL